MYGLFFYAQPAPSKKTCGSARRKIRRPAALKKNHAAAHGEKSAARPAPQKITRQCMAKIRRPHLKKSRGSARRKSPPPGLPAPFSCAGKKENVSHEQILQKIYRNFSRQDVFFLIIGTDMRRKHAPSSAGGWAARRACSRLRRNMMFSISISNKHEEFFDYLIKNAENFHQGAVLAQTVFKDIEQLPEHLPDIIELEHNADETMYQ
jgi:hypothetical protein